ncbi:trans-aconitate 2-methyltransferase [Sporomusa aerivorans]|uniref:class I SAM-dependent methyltransferase n=1 Tax=Sporomusa aerivorans TaxID=204936 RepID=UPI00352B756B
MKITNFCEKLPVDPSPVQNLLTQGVVYELVALAVKEGVFTALTKEKTADVLAAELGWDAMLAELMLKVLVQGGYLTCCQDNYRVIQAVEQFLQPGTPFCLADSLLPEFPAGSFAYRLRQALVNHDSFPGGHVNFANPTKRLSGIGARALTSQFVQTTVQAVSLAQKTKLLDLGGGHGYYSIAFAQKYPQLAVTVFDVPEIAAMASASIQEYGLSSRIRTQPGNFLDEDIGSGYDAVLCSLVLSPPTLGTVLPKVYQALAPQGLLIVRTHISDAPPSLTGSINRLFCALNGHRVMHPISDWQAWLLEYGFQDVQTVSVMETVVVLTAIRK